MKVEADKILILQDIPRFNGVAYDGCWFYMTVSGEHKIMKYNKAFKLLECFDTRKAYTYICYDSREQCFWATVHSDATHIYKLNDSFELIDTLCLSTETVGGSDITGIAYNHNLDLLLISFEKGIDCIEKSSLKQRILVYSKYQERIRGVVGLYSNYFAYVISRPRSEIHIYSNSGSLIKKVLMSNSIHVISITPVQNLEDYHKIYLYVLVINKYGKQCILEYVIEDEQLNEHDLGCNEAIEWIALQGMGIAKNLNEEADKYKRILSASTNKWEIEDANHAICQAIDRATQKERELYYELQKLIGREDVCSTIERKESKN